MKVLCLGKTIFFYIKYLHASVQTIAKLPQIKMERFVTFSMFELGGFLYVVVLLNTVKIHFCWFCIYMHLCIYLMYLLFSKYDVKNSHFTEMFSFYKFLRFKNKIYKRNGKRHSLVLFTSYFMVYFWLPVQFTVYFCKFGNSTYLKGNSTYLQEKQEICHFTGKELSFLFL